VKAIVNGRVLTDAGFVSDTIVLVREGKIAALAPRLDPGFAGDILDAQGKIVAPGFLDIHVHGGAGADTMDAAPQALETIAVFAAAHGVTGFLPTTVTGSQADTMAAICAVAEYARGRHPGAQALGVHLEGPYLNAANLGAQNPRFVRAPQADEYSELFALGNVRLISVAPEIPGSAELIRYAVAQGAAVAIGHSSASYAQVLEAVAQGLTQATHTYNAMSPLHHREPGASGAALTCDRIYAQVIVDLIHVHPAMVKLLVRAKGLLRTVLITDAMRAAGMPDGEYDLGGQQITVKNGEARLPAGNLAGSTLTMERAVRNVMRAADLSLPEALRLASLTPAESIGLAGRKGRLAPGWDADIVLLDEQVNVALTMVGGQVVYGGEPHRCGEPHRRA
jgi:N-acetylglucosamine-6-phosphate deacetylase